jgi:hypothetical protein
VRLKQDGKLEKTGKLYNAEFEPSAQQLNATLLTFTPLQREQIDAIGRQSAALSAACR